jgi:hypothetical protein
MPNIKGTFAITYRGDQVQPLTNDQVDGNFLALNNYALHLTGGVLTGPLTGTTAAFSMLSVSGTPADPTNVVTKAFAEANFLKQGLAAITNADVAPAAAIDYSKLFLTGQIRGEDISSNNAFRIAGAKLNLDTYITNSHISGSAAIAGSKLALTDYITNTMVSSSAAIAYSKLNLSGSIKNADISSEAGQRIAGVKLDLSDRITNADIATGAAIADSKLATITTTGKVANTATTATNANTGGAIVARTAEGAFAAGIVTVTELRSTGEVTAFFTSDARLKENVHTLIAALDRLEEIKGVSFDWSDEYMDSRGGEDGLFVTREDVGVIAQDVQKVLPHAVVQRDNGYLAVRYEKIIPLLVEAVKELRAKVDQIS